MTKMLVFTLHLKVDAKLTTVNEMKRNLFVKQAKSGSLQIPEGKNHNIKKKPFRKMVKVIYM